MLNGVTLAGLYFLVASGFTLVFGLMRNVNLAHGSLYLLGAYVGYDVAAWTDNWFLGVVAGAAAIGITGALLQIFVFQRLTGDELRQTLVTIGISIVAADLMLAVWGGKTYQFSIPAMAGRGGRHADRHCDQVERPDRHAALSSLSAGRSRGLAGDRSGSLAGAQQDEIRHDDPRRRRRSRHAVDSRRQCPSAVRRRLRDRRRPRGIFRA